MMMRDLLPGQGVDHKRPLPVVCPEKAPASRMSGQRKGSNVIEKVGGYIHGGTYR